MTNARAVEDHYTRRSLGDTILSALREAGKDLEHLTPDDLAPVDEFHSGQRNATVRLAQLAGVAVVVNVVRSIGRKEERIRSRSGIALLFVVATVDVEHVVLDERVAQTRRGERGP